MIEIEFDSERIVGYGDKLQIYVMSRKWDGKEWDSKTLFCYELIVSDFEVANPEKMLKKFSDFLATTSKDIKHNMKQFISDDEEWSK